MIPQSFGMVWPLFKDVFGMFCGNIGEFLVLSFVPDFELGWTSRYLQTSSIDIVFLNVCYYQVHIDVHLDK